jgi:hypothetical protein
MKRSLLIALGILYASLGFAQVGFKKKKEDIDKFKDTRLIVVLASDSAYSASVSLAVEKYWTFNSGFLFIPDSMMKEKEYNKPEFSYLFFSKSKGTRIKAKLGSSEVDFNGLVVTTGGKFRKRALAIDLVAGGYCSNDIDTADWYPEIVRAVQMLNNYFNAAIESEDAKAMAGIPDNAPADIGLLDQTILVPLKALDLKGKEDAATLSGGTEIEEVEVDEAYKAILDRTANLVYFYSKADKVCSKIITSTTGELVYYTEDGIDKCGLNAKDFKALKAKREKAAK